jgi:CheY-like chemotaxis protein
MMKTIVITEAPAKFVELNTVSTIMDVNALKELAPASWNLYSEEYLPFYICSQIKDEPALIAVDFAMTRADKYTLANHLMTSLPQASILFVADELPVDLREENDHGVLKNMCVTIRTTSEVCAGFASTEACQRWSKQYMRSFHYLTYVKNCQKFIEFNRHQATNEWGAIKLLLNHGLSIKDISASYQIPETVYFKQKLREQGIGVKATPALVAYPRITDIANDRKAFQKAASQVSKIALIDDNADKGWLFALEKLFGANKVTVFSSFEEADKVKDFGSYDLVFLDLRLPKDATQTVPDIKYGKQLISKIKDDPGSLFVPLIVFTASQSSLIRKDSFQAGADAMYIKESPEWDGLQSLENYHDFIVEVPRQLNKGAELKKYWQAIGQINAQLLTDVKDAAPKKLKSRIKERLEMFYGLVKEQYEHSQYHSGKFYFSGDVLPFITLWSCLNEIQECFFVKQRKTLDVVWNHSRKRYVPLKVKKHAVSPWEDFTYLSDWYIKGQPNDIYFSHRNVSIGVDDVRGFKTRVNGDYLLKYDVECHINYNGNRAPFYSTRDAQSHYHTSYVALPEQKLHLQIAFLLLEKADFKSNASLNKYLAVLKASNVQRNMVYITHGEDGNPTYYQELEKDKVKNLPIKATPNLFALICFLLTGKDTIFPIRP